MTHLSGVNSVKRNKLYKTKIQQHNKEFHESLLNKIAHMQEHVFNGCLVGGVGQCTRGVAIIG